MKTLGEEIRDFRIKNDIPQRKIAHELDIDVAVLSRIENDNGFPKKRLNDLLKRLSSIMNISEDELMQKYLSDEMTDMIVNHPDYLTVLDEVKKKIEYRQSQNLVQSKLTFEKI